MPKTKTKNKTKKCDCNYKIINIVLGCLILCMSGALIFFSTHYKTHFDQEVLDLKDHLFNRHIEMMYGDVANRVCEMESYGLSKDNDVYVRFWCQDYDADSHEPSADKVYRTLYFQHPTKMEGGYSFDYAEALGD